MATHLPETGYVRLTHIIGAPKADPPIPPLIPVGKSTWWEGVREGRYPQPVKLSQKVTVWRAEDIRELITNPEKRDWRPEGSSYVPGKIPVRRRIRIRDAELGRQTRPPRPAPPREVAGSLGPADGKPASSGKRGQGGRDEHR